MKIVLCGMGRIGRSILRILNEKGLLNHLTLTLDQETDLTNLVYLLNYDSTYGFLSDKFINSGNHVISPGGDSIEFSSDTIIDEKFFQDQRWSIFLDSSGSPRDWAHIKYLSEKFNKYFLVTHHPSDFPGTFYVEGVSTPGNSRLISLSICDCVGVAPFIHAINQEYACTSASIVSLHPWLNYQNLLDGTIASVSSPGHSWSNFALGRSSPQSLIPKETTITRSLQDLVSPELQISAMSYRVPTASVTSAIVTLRSIDFRGQTVDQILSGYKRKTEESNILALNKEPLVSIDFLRREEAAIVDERFIFKTDEDLLQASLWYDNEWGYSASVVRRLSHFI